MTKKPQHVPETRDLKPNREQRRHPEGLPEDQPLALEEHPRPMPDPPAKHGHKKPAAEKWNE